MSQLSTYALGSAGSHLGAGCFWRFPLLFTIHDAEEATSVWIKGSLHNSIFYTPLNLLQMLVAISFELTIFAAAASWPAEPGAPRLAIFIFAVLLGGYTAHGFVHLSMRWHAKHYTLGAATALPLVMLPLIRVARWFEPDLRSRRAVLRRAIRSGEKRVRSR